MHRLAPLLIVGLGLAACFQRPAEAPGPTDYLVEQGLLSVLVEESRLAAPPAFDRNRLAAGWRPVEGGTELLPVGERQTLEIVNLAPRDRTLHLRFSGPPTAPGSVTVYGHGSKLAEAAWARQISLPLPPGSAPQSHFLQLAFSPPAPAVTGLRVTPSLDAGEVQLDGRSIRQSPSSAVEILHRAPRPGLLEFLFEPPASAGQEQRFEAWLEDAAGRRQLASFGDGDGRRRVSAEVAAGSFALTLSATGVGQPVRWVEPRWRPLVPVKPPASSASALSADPTGTARSAQATRPRLVIVYVLDALRYDAIEALEQRGSAPFLARLGEEGVGFGQHRSVAPNTLPATASLFYGRLFEKTLEPRDVLVPDLEPLAETFRRAGYRTALFSSNVYVTGEFYMDRGFDHVEPRMDSAVVGENLASEIVTAAALDWISLQDPASELFLYLHVINPHNPFTPPPAFQSSPGDPFVADTPALVEIREGRLEPDARQILRLREAYLDSFAYADAVLETFITRLGDRYGRSEMAVAVTSDHGEELLEHHGGILHGHSLYEEALHIPLVLWPPEIFGRGRIERATSTLDTYRWLAALAEGRPLELAVPGELDGLTVTAGSSVPRGLLGVQRGRWKVVLTGTRRDEWGMGYGPARTWDTEYLFDLEQGETENRLGHGDLEARWLRAFARRLAASHRGQGAELFTDFDDETTEKLRSLGYL